MQNNSKKASTTAVAKALSLSPPDSVDRIQEPLPDVKKARTDATEVPMSAHKESERPKEPSKFCCIIKLETMLGVIATCFGEREREDREVTGAESENESYSHSFCSKQSRESYADEGAAGAGAVKEEEAGALWAIEDSERRGDLSSDFSFFFDFIALFWVIGAEGRATKKARALGAAEGVM